MQRKNTKMPPGVYEVFSQLEEDFLWLRDKWRVLQVVYVEGEDRLPLLNRFAGGFFGVAQRVLVDDVILSLGRLLDKEQICRKDNLSLTQLVCRIRKSGQSGLADELDGLRQSAEAQIQPLLVHRHKRLAHRDLSVAVKPKSLPGITIQDVNRILQTVQRMLAKVLWDYERTEDCYDEFDGADDAARRLFRSLEEWDAARREKAAH